MKIRINHEAHEGHEGTQIGAERVFDPSSRGSYDAAGQDQQDVQDNRIKEKERILVRSTG